MPRRTAAPAAQDAPAKRKAPKHKRPADARYGLTSTGQPRRRDQALALVPANQQAITDAQPVRLGAPRKWTDPAELDIAIEAYFSTRTPMDPPTVSGLAVALDTNRMTLLNYLNGSRSDDAQFSVAPAFVYLLKRARARIEESMELALLTREKTPVGHIFSLKNNYGWRDVQEVEHSGGVTVSLGMPGQTLRAPVIDVTPK